MGLLSDPVVVCVIAAVLVLAAHAVDGFGDRRAPRTRALALGLCALALVIPLAAAGRLLAGADADALVPAVTLLGTAVAIMVSGAPLLRPPPAGEQVAATSEAPKEAADTRSRAARPGAGRRSVAGAPREPPAPAGRTSPGRPGRARAAGPGSVPAITPDGSRPEHAPRSEHPRPGRTDRPGRAPQRDRDDGLASGTAVDTAGAGADRGEVEGRRRAPDPERVSVRERRRLARRRAAAAWRVPGTATAPGHRSALADQEPPAGRGGPRVEESVPAPARRAEEAPDAVDDVLGDVMHQLHLHLGRRDERRGDRR